MLPPFSPDILWIVIVGFVIAFVLAFGIGANDVANSFGTSVGSRVLTVRQACILATIFEIAGAILIGYKVSDTMRKGILDVNLYADSEAELMLGMLSALGGSAVWLMVATFLKLPISGTHSIVGATIGFSLVARGTSGLHWTTLGTIVASWFVSPVLSGLISMGLYILIRKLILEAEQPVVPGLRALPIFYGLTVLINVFSVVYSGPKLLYFHYIPWWGSIIVSVGVGIIVALCIQLILAPHLRRKILESSRDASPRPSRAMSIEDVKRPKGEIGPAALEPTSVVDSTTSPTVGTNGVNHPPLVNGTKTNGYINNSLSKEAAVNGNGTTLPTPGVTSAPVQTNLTPALPPSGNATPAMGLSPNSSAVPLIKERTPEPVKPDVEVGQLTLEEGDADEPHAIKKLFSSLQILTATFGAFAHGGNDVSNAIGPLIALWLIYTEGSVAQKSESPLYILLYGGVGIAVGLWIWGRRVIQTIGEDLTKITASTGFTIEIGAAFTVLLASQIGLPISTTHCKVGSVVFVGWASSSKEGVNWKLFKNIISAWVLTLPVAAGLSALLMFILQNVAL
ncbi:hypothetical protein R5R35_009182 [Gryllus longicercus]|uniref:Phosphate transporter n=1 Tax=Gryllus longicercus TaxID=2509291 RepID=A0AAN9VKA9_9ORTH